MRISERRRRPIVRNFLVLSLFWVQLDFLCSPILCDGMERREVLYYEALFCVHDYFIARSNKIKECPIWCILYQVSTLIYIYIYIGSSIRLLSHNCHSLSSVQGLARLISPNRISMHCECIRNKKMSRITTHQHETSMVEDDCVDTSSYQCSYTHLNDAIECIG